ncbi:MAG TPA: fibronectin type III domain-containing protein, partial [Acidimicrobiales bacterium]
MSCPSTTVCVSVQVTNEVVSTASESSGVWTWTNSSVALDASGSGVFNSVSCPNTTLCVAVGTDENSQEISTVGTYSAANSTWSWSATQIVAPDASTVGQLNGVSCPSVSTCVAIGDDGNSTSVFVAGTIANGVITWSATTAISAGSLGTDEFYKISCPSTTDCVAAGIGTASNEEAAVSTGSYANGVWTWTSATEITPDSSNKSIAEDVSCASTTACLVVGWDWNSQPAYASGSYANGSWTWSAMTPLPIGALGSTNLFGVSCGNATTCVAVGDDMSDTANLASGVWTWNPIDTVPTDGSTTSLEGVSCANAITCLAVGVDGNSRSIYDPTAVVPGAPTIGAPTSAYTAANVSWSAGSTGGATITGYTLNAFNASTNQTTDDACPSSTTSSATTCTVTGLTDGDSYTFTVAAINGVGQGPFSSPSATVLPAPTAPAPPTSVTAVASGSSATVNWTAGATNGDPITGYVVSSSAEGVQT